MISVCLASYNGETYIVEQVKSILRSAKVGELLISDDGSTDNTLALLKQLQDPRIRLLAGPGQGLINNFEFALQQAQGDVVFLCDQDDVWLENKVDVTLTALEHADLVVSDCKVVNSHGEVIDASFFALRRSGPGFIKNLTRNSFLGCCMAFRRSVLEAALPFPQPLPMHDWWLGLVASMTGRVAFVDSPLTLYRRHGGNASQTAGKSSATTLTQIAWRVSLLWNLFKRFVALKLR